MYLKEMIARKHVTNNSLKSKKPCFLKYQTIAYVLTFAFVFEI